MVLHPSVPRDKYLCAAKAPDTSPPKAFCSVSTAFLFCGLIPKKTSCSFRFLFRKRVHNTVLAVRCPILSFVHQQCKNRDVELVYRRLVCHPFGTTALFCSCSKRKSYHRVKQQKKKSTLARRYSACSACRCCSSYCFLRRASPHLFGKMSIPLQGSALNSFLLCSF